MVQNKTPRVHVQRATLGPIQSNVPGLVPPCQEGRLCVLQGRGGHGGLPRSGDGCSLTRGLPPHQNSGLAAKRSGCERERSVPFETGREFLLPGVVRTALHFAMGENETAHAHTQSDYEGKLCQFVLMYIFGRLHVTLKDQIKQGPHTLQLEGSMQSRPIKRGGNLSYLHCFSFQATTCLSTAGHLCAPNSFV